jgi:hypothetical protein
MGTMPIFAPDVMNRIDPGLCSVSSSRPARISVCVTWVSASHGTLLQSSIQTYPVEANALLEGKRRRKHQKSWKLVSSCA